MQTVVKNPQDNQEVFDFVVNALRKQGRKSASGDRTTCAYRGNNNTKCAAGHLIPDELYNVNMESPYGLDACCAPPSVKDFFIKSGYNLDLVIALQRIHDGCNVGDWERGWNSVAQNFDLKYNPPTTAFEESLL